MTDAPVERGAEGIWARLRRRKVVQWGLVYVAGAWGFLQGLEYVSEAFEWPPQIRQIALLLLLIGLPVVLVLAWYHGDRGQRRITTSEFAIITLLLLLGGGAFWYYQRKSDASADSATTASTAQPDTSVETKDARPSVAVLPFKNRSRLEDDAFFVDGIHDDILTQLSKIEAMKVIARTSVERFRDTKLTTKEIGETLGVTKVLEGAVQRAGNRVRVTVQLIDATTEAHMWAESYDRELTAANIFAIQSEVAAAIADALKATLTPAEKTRAMSVPTQNLQAWEAYQLGKRRLTRRTTADLVDAEQFFRQAIGLDPKFALAYVGLADALSLQITYSGASSKVTHSHVEMAVAEALKLDANLAEAWASSGGVAQDRWQFDRAEAMFRRAIELNPNYATARHWYSMMLRDVGRADEAFAQIQRAVELDPLSAVITETLGEIQESHGRFHEAEVAYRRAITIDPSRPAPYLGLALLNAYGLDHVADAIPLVQKAAEIDPGAPYLASSLSALYFTLGDENKFAELAGQAAKRWPEDPVVQFQLARVKLRRLDAVGAARHAQRALDVYPRHDWALRTLRDTDMQLGRYDAAIVRYEKAYPELFVREGRPRIDGANYAVAIDVALVAQKQGNSEQAAVLLDGAAHVIRTMPRLGFWGYGIADVQIQALRGQKATALTGLREAERAGWRRWWPYHRDFDPALASIRDEPEFKAVFADIERDMATQRARLAARPKDAPLEWAATGT